MRFRTFPKLTTSVPERAPEGPYLALEKIHGAQLVLGLDAGGRFHAGKRKAWLDPEEPFFGWQLLRATLEEAVRALDVDHDGELVVFGELFGGSYPHPDVPRLRAFSAVQTGIWYAPDLRFAPFAILLAAPDTDGGQFLAPSEMLRLAGAVDLVPPPLVGRGNRGQVLGLPTRSETRVPALLGLPPIKDNTAEGFVVQLDRPSTQETLVAWKHKIPEMNEADFDGSAAFDPHRILPREELLGLVPRLVNPARLASARSKVGLDPTALVEEIELDVRIDLEAALPATMRILDDPTEDALAQEIRERARGLLSFFMDSARH
jgi:Rnl2 family RNA ligase